MDIKFIIKYIKKELEKKVNLRPDIMELDPGDASNPILIGFYGIRTVNFNIYVKFDEFNNYVYKSFYNNNFMNYIFYEIENKLIPSETAIEFLGGHCDMYNGEKIVRFRRLGKELIFNINTKTFNNDKATELYKKIRKKILKEE